MFLEPIKYQLNSKLLFFFFGGGGGGGLTSVDCKNLCFIYNHSIINSFVNKLYLKNSIFLMTVKVTHNFISYPQQRRGRE